MTNRKRWTDDQVEQTMGNLLRIGVILAAAVVLLGGVIYLARNGHDVPDYETFHSVPAQLRSLSGTFASARHFAVEGSSNLACCCWSPRRWLASCCRSSRLPSSETAGT